MSLDVRTFARDLFMVAGSPVVHVHRDGRAVCPTVRRKGIQRPVSANQCLIYKLAGCPECFPVAAEFERMVRHGGGS